jgi:predicted ATPase
LLDIGKQFLGHLMHEPYVTSATIAKFPDLGGGTWTLAGLTPVFVLFGKNGSGKSRMLRAWRDQDSTNIHYVIPERAGTLDFEASYMRQELTGDARQPQAQRNYLPEYRQRVVTRIQAYFAARGNVRSERLPGNPADLETLLSQLTPDFEIKLDAVAAQPYRLTRLSDGSAVSSIDQLSSGEAQLVTIGLDILTVAAIWELEGRSKRLVLIDEPDAHIHPDLQVRLADFLLQAAERYELQIGVATHSTSLLAAIGQFGARYASVAYLNRNSAEVVCRPFDRLNRELASCLGGHALMGPLFGIPLLLVEGDDDFRIWSQVPRYHQVSLAVIPSGGDEIKNYQRALEQVFSALREPGEKKAGYALLDGDKGKPTDASSPQVHVAYIQLHCHESENLYLADEVLSSLGLSWDEAKEKILLEADRFGPKAEKLRTAGTWDRKRADIKDVINQLELILDQKRVHWTLRVAKAVGSARPAGQLLEFLGEEVVTALWGTWVASI